LKFLQHKRRIRPGTSNGKAALASIKFASAHDFSEVRERWVLRCSTNFGKWTLVIQIKLGFDIAYTAPQPTPMVIMLSIHPSRRHDIVGTETIVADRTFRSVTTTTPSAIFAGG
jgi:hypothetical protein